MPTDDQPRFVPGHADLARLRSLTCAKWTFFDDDVLAAWVADMDFEPAPEIVDALRALVDRADFGYNFSAFSGLKDAFIDWQSRRHGWEPDPKGVRVWCDVVQAVEAALWLGTEPGDGVVLFTPVYPPFFGAVESSGRRVIDCPLDPADWSLDPERLAAAIDERTTAILLCNPHNPTGRTFSAAELDAIASVAERHDLLVISDEIWADIVHPEGKHIPFGSLDRPAAERSVVVTAASKAFNLAGLRCAIGHVADKQVAEGLAKLPSHLLGAVGSPGAEATLAAWTRAEPWLDATVAFLTQQRDHVAQRLAAELPAARMVVPEATYLAWIDLSGADGGDEPADVLLERGRVALSKGTDFGIHGRGFVRLNFATSREILDAVIDRVVEIFPEQR